MSEINDSQNLCIGETGSCQELNGEENRSVLLLLKGHPGTGKSTLGCRLAHRLGWPLIDKDDAKNALQSVAVKTTDKEINWNSLSYDIMWCYVETQLKCGLSCIVDCPLARKQLWDQANSLANKYSTKVVIVECFASNESIWADRLHARWMADKDSNRAHKPANMSEVMSIIERNKGSETWTKSIAENVSIIHVDTTAHNIDYFLDKIKFKLNEILSE